MAKWEEAPLVESPKWAEAPLVEEPAATALAVEPQPMPTVANLRDRLVDRPAAVVKLHDETGLDYDEILDAYANVDVDPLAVGSLRPQRLKQEVDRRRYGNFLDRVGLREIGQAAQQIVSDDELAAELVPRLEWYKRYLTTFAGRFERPEAGVKYLKEGPQPEGPDAVTRLEPGPPVTRLERLKQAIRKRTGYFEPPIYAVREETMAQRLRREAEEFKGFGPALMPMAGEFGITAIEWGLIYPKLFQAFGMTGAAVQKIPQVERAVKALGGATRVAELSAKHPRQMEALGRAVKSFAKGYGAGATMAAIDHYAKGGSAIEVLRNINKQGVALGSFAAVFSLASSVDTALYARKLRADLVARATKRYQARIQALPKKMADPKAKMILRAEEMELRQIDHVVAAVEDQLNAVKSGMWRAGQEGVESPTQAAERIYKHGYRIGDPIVRARPAMRTGLAGDKGIVRGEVWYQVQRQRALRMAASADPEVQKRGNGILDWLEGVKPPGTVVRIEGQGRAATVASQERPIGPAPAAKPAPAKPAAKAKPAPPSKQPTAQHQQMHEIISGAVTEIVGGEPGPETDSLIENATTKASDKINNIHGPISEEQVAAAVQEGITEAAEEARVKEEAEAHGPESPAAMRKLGEEEPTAAEARVAKDIAHMDAQEYWLSEGRFRVSGAYDAEATAEEIMAARREAMAPHEEAIRAALKDGTLSPEEALRLHAKNYPDIDTWPEYEEALELAGSAEAPAAKEPWEMTREEWPSWAPPRYEGAAAGTEGLSAAQMADEAGLKPYRLSKETEADARGEGTRFPYRGTIGKTVTLYRAVPGQQSDIRPGEYATLSREYAVEHLKAHQTGRYIENPELVQGGKVISRQVPTREVVVLANNEVAWVPPEPHGIVIQQALSEEKPVPRHVLEEYRGEPWADAALGKREKEVAPGKEGWQGIVYHGGKALSKFAPGETIWLSTSKDVAGVNATQAWKWHRIKGLGGKPEEVFPIESATLSMERPFIVDAEGEYYQNIPTPKEMAKEIDSKTVDSDIIVDWAKENDYDGVVIKNVIEGKGADSLADTIAVFDVNKVQSVTPTPAAEPPAAKAAQPTAEGVEKAKPAKPPEISVGAAAAGFTDQNKALQTALKRAAKTGQDIYVVQNKEGKFRTRAKKPHKGHYTLVTPEGEMTFIKQASLRAEDSFDYGEHRRQTTKYRDKLAEFKAKLRAKEADVKAIRQEIKDYIRTLPDRDKAKMWPVWEAVTSRARPKTNLKQIGRAIGRVEEILRGNDKRDAIRSLKQTYRTLKDKYRRAAVVLDKVPEDGKQGFIAAVNELRKFKPKVMKEANIERADAVLRTLAQRTHEALSQLTADERELADIGDDTIDHLLDLTKKSLPDMTADEIRSIGDILLSVVTRLERARETRYAESRAKATAEIAPTRKASKEAAAPISEATKRGRLERSVNAIRQLWNVGAAHLDTLIEYATQNGSTEMMRVLWDDLVGGLRESMRIFNESARYTWQRYEEVGFTLKDARRMVRESITVSIGGRKVKITRSDAVGFYAHVRSKGNLERLLGTEATIIGGKRYEGAISLDELTDMFDELTEQEKAAVQVMAETNAFKLREPVNATSRTLEGKDKATDPAHFSVHRERGKTVTGDVWVSSRPIERKGRYQPRRGGTLPIRIVPFHIELMDAMQADAYYGGMAVPMMNARTLINNRDFQVAMRQAGHGDVLDAMMEILNRVQGMNTDRSIIDRWGHRRIANFATSVLGLRISTIGNQFCSWPAFFSEINPRYFVGLPVLSPATAKQYIAEIEKYDPLFIERWMAGRLNFALGALSAENGFETFLFGATSLKQKATAGLIKGDQAAILQGYAAIRRETADLHPELEGEAFTRHCVERLGRATQRTQPMWNNLFRSLNSGNPSIVHRSLWLFMSAREQQYNITQRAANRYAKSEKTAADAAQLGNDVGAVVMANAQIAVWKRALRWTIRGGLLAALGVLGFLPDKDDDEIKDEKNLGQLTKDIAADTTENVVSLAPLGTQIWRMSEWMYDYATDRPMFFRQDPVSLGPLEQLVVQAPVAHAKFVRAVVSMIEADVYQTGPKKGSEKWPFELTDAMEELADFYAKVYGLPFSGPYYEFYLNTRNVLNAERPYRHMTEEALGKALKDNCYQSSGINKWHERYWPGKPQHGRENYVEALQAERDFRRKSKE